MFSLCKIKTSEVVKDGEIQVKKVFTFECGDMKLVVSGVGMLEKYGLPGRVDDSVSLEFGGNTKQSDLVSKVYGDAE